MSVAEGSVWPKVLASFAAGIVCMSLISEKDAAPARPMPEKQAARPVAPSSEATAVPTEAVPRPEVAATPKAEPAQLSMPAPAKASSCGDDPTRGAGDCPAQAQPARPDNRAIRVITTDKPFQAAAPARKVQAPKLPPEPSLPQESVEDKAALEKPPSPTNSPPASPATASTEATTSSAAKPDATASAGPAVDPQARSTASDVQDDPAAKPDGAATAVNAAAPVPSAQPAGSAKGRGSKSRRLAGTEPAEPASRPTRAQRQATMRRDAYERDLAAGRIRTIRLANGRVVEIRLSRREMRAYDDDDLPPPPRGRYRRGPDSVTTWLGSPYD